jgi:class 3 adenylate cyclase
LQELRWAAIESWVDAELQRGQHRELVGELEALVSEQPTREGLAGQLMVALYRCGRQAEALEVYRRSRTHLAEELGLDPGPELRALQAQILEQAPSLQPPAGAHAVGPAEPGPSPPADFGSSASGRKHRKTLTVLFVDVVASSAAGAQLDPEALRGLAFRYYGVLRAAVEAHGGSVQRFAGGPVLAIFGVPVVHEDEPLRAVRAAVQARRELVPLAEELGLRIEARAGISTGQAVVGERTGAEELVVGDVVNVGARLLQSTSGGETLIGQDAYMSVGLAVRAERVELAVRGDGEPLAAYRLVEVLEGVGRRAPQRRSPLVGRARELGCSWPPTPALDAKAPAICSRC